MMRLLRLTLVWPLDMPFYFWHECCGGDLPSAYYCRGGLMALGLLSSTVLLHFEGCKVWLVFSALGFFPFSLFGSLWLSSSASRPVQYCTDLVGSLALLWEKEEKKSVHGLRSICRYFGINQSGSKRKMYERMVKCHVVALRRRALGLAELQQVPLFFLTQCSYSLAQRDDLPI